MATERPGHLRRNWFYFLTDAGLADLSKRALGLPGVRWALKGTLVLAALGFFYVARQPFSPSDWVEITVRNVPKGLRGGTAEIRLPDESRAVAPSRELLKQVGAPDESI